MIINDSHCHFFSNRFFQTLASEKGIQSQDSAAVVAGLIGWEKPGTPQELASSWVKELDRNQVSRAALIASVPKDEESVSAAVKEYPDRFVGFFMLDPRSEDAAQRVKWAVQELELRCVCLFPE